jgi:hypothetical protein
MAETVAQSILGAAMRMNEMVTMPVIHVRYDCIRMMMW